GSQSPRQLMIAIARSRTPNADHSYCPLSVGDEPARPMTTVLRQLTVAAMATPTRSLLRHTPPPVYPAIDPISWSRSRRRSRSPAARKSPSLEPAAPVCHTGPRFPPSRLIRRLPSERAAPPSDGQVSDNP